MYKIKITKLVENPNYEEEAKKLDDRRKNRFYNQYDEPIPNDEYGNKFLTDRVLEVDLTDEEFQKVKQGVLEVV
jgi:hypothetical protein